MKKILSLISIFVISMFLNVKLCCAFEKKVIHEEVEYPNFGWAVCTYIIDNYEISYTLESNGEGKINKDFNSEVINSNLRTNYSFSDYLSGSNFVSKSTNKFSCPSKIYIKYEGGGKTTGVKIFYDKKNGNKEISLDSSKSKNNNKPISNSSKPTISCDYTATKTQGKGTVNATIVSDGSKITSQFYSGSYKPQKDDYPEIAKLFKDSNGKLHCPNLYISCGSSGSNSFCTISENNNIYGISFSGTESNDADKINGKNDNPNENDEKINLNYTTGCGIISNDLKDWMIQLLDIVKIGALILTLILGMVDFLKGVASGDDDAMKKVWKSFSRRLIALVLLFLLPVIIEFILGLVTINGVDASNPLCGIS